MFLIPPRKTGRRFADAVNPTIVLPPAWSPAAPTPAIARPTMRAVVFGGTPGAVAISKLAFGRP